MHKIKKYIWMHCHVKGKNGSFNMWLALIFFSIFEYFCVYEQMFYASSPYFFVSYLRFVCTFYTELTYGNTDDYSTTLTLINSIDSNKYTQTKNRFQYSLPRICLQYILSEIKKQGSLMRTSTHANNVRFIKKKYVNFSCISVMF